MNTDFLNSIPVNNLNEERNKALSLIDNITIVENSTFEGKLSKKELAKKIKDICGIAKLIARESPSSLNDALIKYHNMGHPLYKNDFKKFFTTSSWLTSNLPSNCEYTKEQIESLFGFNSHNKDDEFLRIMFNECDILDDTCGMANYTIDQIYNLTVKYIKDNNLDVRIPTKKNIESKISERLSNLNYSPRGRGLKNSDELISEISSKCNSLGRNYDFSNVSVPYYMDKDGSFYPVMFNINKKGAYNLKVGDNKYVEVPLYISGVTCNAKNPDGTPHGLIDGNISLHTLLKGKCHICKKCNQSLNEMVIFNTLVSMYGENNVSKTPYNGSVNNKQDEIDIVVNANGRIINIEYQGLYYHCSCISDYCSKHTEKTEDENIADIVNYIRGFSFNKSNQAVLSSFSIKGEFNRLITDYNKFLNSKGNNRYIVNLEYEPDYCGYIDLYNKVYNELGMGGIYVVNMEINDMNNAIIQMKEQLKSCGILDRKKFMTEDTLFGSIVNEYINDAINEEVEEGKFGKALGSLALGAMMGHGSAQAQNAQPVQDNTPRTEYRTPDSIRYQFAQDKADSIAADKIYDREDSIRNNPISVDELKKAFPQAYQDRYAGEGIWRGNVNQYDGSINGKNSLVARVAASHGENPWIALVEKYCGVKQGDPNFNKIADYNPDEKPADLMDYINKKYGTNF